ncbi:hypothetical protein L2E82_17305 [Cichorium intybus]|uniref:Uncharacterized protein n=1 Tax=Cichorium intybus TaxID=13427 RepID=A0ACB9F970_CICIN|nr:hypothetical protein L2E82_17305 [Cichorium intybus]
MTWPDLNLNDFYHWIHFKVDLIAVFIFVCFYLDAYEYGIVSDSRHPKLFGSFMCSTRSLSMYEGAANGS